MLLQVFLAPEVKRSAIIGTKHGIYKLPHEVPIDLKIIHLRKLGKVRKISKVHRVIT